jgi:DNA invertase Pin-like site-specific DNA recombinase
MLSNNDKQVNRGKLAIYCCLINMGPCSVNPKVKLLQYGIDRNLKFDFFNEKETIDRSRPVKRELLRKLDNGNYSEVVVYKLDQWARSSKELIIGIKELLDNKIGFVSVSDNINLNDPLDESSRQIIDGFAKFEVSLQSN